MIDYKAYDKIIKLINEGKEKELREYLEKEKEKYYVSTARETLKHYLRHESTLSKIVYLDYLEDQRLFFTDSSSLYILNSDEILNASMKKKREGLLHAKTPSLIALTDGFEQGSLEPVQDIVKSREDGSLVLLSSSDMSRRMTFSSKQIEYSKIFLGPDVEYSLTPHQNPACFARSRKGRGVICGFRD